MKHSLKDSQRKGCFLERVLNTCQQALCFSKALCLKPADTSHSGNIFGDHKKCLWWPAVKNIPFSLFVSQQELKKNFIYFTHDSKYLLSWLFSLLSDSRCCKSSWLQFWPLVKCKRNFSVCTSQLYSHDLCFTLSLVAPSTKAAPHGLAHCKENAAQGCMLLCSVGTGQRTAVMHAKGGQTIWLLNW